jgi:hypothetical protein
MSHPTNSRVFQVKCGCCLKPWTAQPLVTGRDSGSWILLRYPQEERSVF